MRAKGGKTGDSSGPARAGAPNSIAHDVGAAETETRDGGAEFRHLLARHRADAQAPHLLARRDGIEQARIANARVFEHGQRALGVGARGETGDLQHDAVALSRVRGFGAGEAARSKRLYRRAPAAFTGSTGARLSGVPDFPVATRTCRSFIHLSNSSAVIALPSWRMSKRQGPGGLGSGSAFAVAGLRSPASALAIGNAATMRSIALGTTGGGTGSGAATRMSGPRSFTVSARTSTRAVPAGYTPSFTAAA